MAKQPEEFKEMFWRMADFGYEFLSVELLFRNKYSSHSATYIGEHFVRYCIRPFG